MSWVIVTYFVLRIPLVICKTYWLLVVTYANIVNILYATLKLEFKQWQLHLFKHYLNRNLRYRLTFEHLPDPYCTRNFVLKQCNNWINIHKAFQLFQIVYALFLNDCCIFYISRVLKRSWYIFIISDQAI